MATSTAEIVGFLPGLTPGDLVQIGGGIYRYAGVKNYETDVDPIFTFIKNAGDN